MACSFLLITSSFAIDLPENYIKESILISKDLHQEEEIIQHIQDANEQDKNPVVLAIKKDKIELAELLLIIRRIELSLGIETFDFPGYSFSRPYGNEVEEAILHQLFFLPFLQMDLPNKKHFLRMFCHNQIHLHRVGCIQRYLVQH